MFSPLEYVVYSALSILGFFAIAGAASAILIASDVFGAWVILAPCGIAVAVGYAFILKL